MDRDKAVESPQCEQFNEAGVRFRKKCGLSSWIHGQAFKKQQSGIIFLLSYDLTIPPWPVLYILLILIFVRTPSSSKPACAGPSEEQKERALSYGAILHITNGENPSILGAGIVAENRKTMLKKSLSEWWNINSREDLLRTLKWIVDGGHSRKLYEKKRSIEGMPIEQLHQAALSKLKDNDIDEYNRTYIAALNLHDKRTDMLQITAWDIARYINPCS